MKGFKEFLMQGNLIDLAVAVIIGAAFGALVKAFTDAFITPLIAAITGGGTTGGTFTINDQVFNYGAFISAIITFVLTAADGTELKAKNAADGKIAFPALTFDKPGTYEFALTELDDAHSNVTYDKRAYKVTVTVINDGLGHRNFNAFLNRYRLDEAKAALADAGQADVERQQFPLHLRHHR